MILCSKCGSKNVDDAKFCIRCGESLTLKKETHTKEWGEEFGKKMEKWGEDLGKRMEERGEEFGRSMEEECFGLPNIGAIIGIIIGVFIIIFGASLAFGLDIYVWGRWLGLGILILVGLVIMISSIYGITRKRRE